LWRILKSEHLLKSSEFWTLTTIASLVSYLVESLSRDIPSVDFPNINTRINVRGFLTPGRVGNFADGIIGGTSVQKGVNINY
jgi:hypothetical protein